MSYTKKVIKPNAWNDWKLIMWTNFYLNKSVLNGKYVYLKQINKK